MDEFSERVVVVTGVGHAGQVGEAVAEAFARRGAALVLLDRDADEVAARAAALVGHGHRAVAHPCDLTDAAAVDDVARRVGKAFGGRVDAVVHVAGGFAMSGPVAGSDPAVLQRQFAINVVTAYLATRAFVPLLRPARGSLVYFASAAVLPGAAGARMSAYAIAKSGVLALMRAVSEEEQGAGVRANAVAPTSIRTAANVASMGEDQRYVSREEVAETVVYLCSDAARAVTGAVLRLG